MHARVLRSALLASSASLVLASTALASKPDREFSPLPDDIFLAASPDVCAFDVNLHVDTNNEYTKIWTDSAGNVLMFAINGNLQFTATNLSSGASLQINASGPGRIVFDDQGNPVVYVGEGHFLAWGGGGMFLYTGLLDFNSGSFQGHVSDVCAALA